MLLNLNEKKGTDYELGKTNLNLIYEILTFVFRNEADLSQANVDEWKIGEKIDENVVVCLSALLMMGLSIGG